MQRRNQQTNRRQATPTAAATPATLYAKVEQAIQAKRLTAEQAFTLFKIEQTLLAQPDGAFAELLIGMLTASQPVKTDSEYADAEAMGKEMA